MTGDAVKVFDVEYRHIHLPDGADLYLTRYGLPFYEQLLPENHFADKTWFQDHSHKLHGHTFRSGGTSTIYRATTKSVAGKAKDIVLKWNRVAQDVPGYRDADELLTAEFNSPFEEFALLFEMRGAWRDTNGQRILTHKPLAIYVPAEPVEPWRLGRKEYLMEQKIRRHPEALLDMYRRYAVIYEWIKGTDLYEVCHRGGITEAEMVSLTESVDAHLADLGFAVRDRKPQHIIVRPDNDEKKTHRDRKGVPYALVDFELLERTTERDTLIRTRKRTDYLRHQAHRFEVAPGADCPAHLSRLNILGVDYVYGATESTRGALWIVGRDPTLFDYFLPERWEHTPRERLAAVEGIYHTLTKDSIHLVWKLSRVGEVPEMDPFQADERRMIAHGYNSPFEEVALALDLSRKGMATVYPRAIYMSGEVGEQRPEPFDGSRYHSHADISLPDGTKALKEGRKYIIIWGYWNKPDEALAQKDRDYYDPIDALKAMRIGLTTEAEYVELMEDTKAAIESAGIDELNLRGHHKLLATDVSGNLVRDGLGNLSVRLCNFELMRWQDAGHNE